MNEQELQAIEERANAATLGEWGTVRASNDVRIWRDDCIVAIFPDAMPYYTTAHNADADAAFCVTARADVPALIAEVRSLRAKLDAVPVEELRFWWDPFKNALTADAVEEAAATIEAWLKAQAVQP